MILLCGCEKNEGKVKSISFSHDVAFQDGNYWITGAVRDDDLSVIAIIKRNNLLNHNNIYLAYTISSQNDNIVLSTTSLPNITIKPGFGGVYYIRGNCIEFYKKDMTPEFLSVFFRNLKADQNYNKFNIVEFCNTIGADLTPVQLNFSDLQ